MTNQEANTNYVMLIIVLLTTKSLNWSKDQIDNKLKQSSLAKTKINQCGIKKDLESH